MFLKEHKKQKKWKISYEAEREKASRELDREKACRELDVAFHEYKCRVYGEENVASLDDVQLEVKSLLRQNIRKLMDN